MMMSQLLSISTLIAIVVVVAASAAAATGSSSSLQEVLPGHLRNMRVTDPSAMTALDRYVAKPDSHFSWNNTGQVIKGPGYKVYMLNMTSQQWLTPAQVSRSIWWHVLAVTVPDVLTRKDKGFLYITGGSNTDTLPDGKSEDILLCGAVAVSTGSVCAALFQVPNEHITFAEDPSQDSRDEDAIIAWTWYHFAKNTSDTEWLLRLPMTKAAVRGMDAITEFMQKTTGNVVTDYVVGGASKRGWTTWTTAAVDKRVVGATPIVMDLLNMVKNCHHMWRAFGGWTFAFKDYYALNFTAWLDRPSTQLMADIIDPYVYRDRLTMPKLVIDAGGDEFFMPDDNHFWYDDMEGETHLLMIQNAEHSMATGVIEIVKAISGFANALFSNLTRPSMKWDMTSNATHGTISVTTSEAPLEVFVRYADTLDDKRRDWRLVTGPENCTGIVTKGVCLHPVLWKTESPTNTSATEFSVTMPTPTVGWRAFFIEAKFKPEAGPLDIIDTTQVNIIPPTYPFEDCEGLGCKGTLI